jgi:hypothetical protein
MLQRVRLVAFAAVVVGALLCARPALAQACADAGPCEDCNTPVGWCATGYNGPNTCTQWQECRDVGLCLESGL